MKKTPEVDFEKQIAEAKKNFSPQLMAIMAVLGGGPVYVMSEYFYTRREAQIELEAIKNSSTQMLAQQKETKTEILRALQETNARVDRFLETMRMFRGEMREFREERRHASSKGLLDEENEGG